MPRHALSPGAAFGNETESTILRASATQNPLAANISSPGKSTNRRHRGKHRKPSKLPVSDLRIPAGATLGLMGAVLLPQLASSPASGAMGDLAKTDSNPMTRQASEAFQKVDRITGKDAVKLAKKAPKHAAVQHERAGKHALREQRAQMPQKTLAQWAQENSHIGIPVRALEAYGNAERVMRKQQPKCGIPWTMVAGIGRIESNHGQFDGASLLADGLSTKQIIGIALDGSSGVRAITDTDDGKMDNDQIWDRAVGPMQFLPSTWRKWAEDANGDNFKDPHFIDDAALTAANYLCGHGSDLSTEEGQRAALMSYNNSSSYGDMAIEGAERYGEESTPLPPESSKSAAGLA
jgi:membrane-bound lytic murein transglycosylase B